MILLSAATGEATGNSSSSSSSVSSILEKLKESEERVERCVEQMVLFAGCLLDVDSSPENFANLFEVLLSLYLFCLCIEF